MNYEKCGLLEIVLKQHKLQSYLLFFAIWNRVLKGYMYYFCLQSVDNAAVL